MKNEKESHLFFSWSVVAFMTIVGMTMTCNRYDAMNIHAWRKTEMEQKSDREICILCVCVVINKRSFEPFCVWIKVFTTKVCTTYPQPFITLFFQCTGYYVLKPEIIIRWVSFYKQLYVSQIRTDQQLYFYLMWERERGGGGGRQTDRQTDSDRDRDRQRETYRDRQRDELVVCNYDYNTMMMWRLNILRCRADILGTNDYKRRRRIKPR